MVTQFDMLIEGAICQGCGKHLKANQVWVKEALFVAYEDYLGDRDWPVPASSKAFHGQTFRHYKGRAMAELCGEVSLTASPLVMK